MTAGATVAGSAAPALGPERPVVWPPRMVRRLANGLEVVLVEAHGVPRLVIDLILRSGNAATALTSPGLAEMVSATVRTGTLRRTRRQIEEDLRRMGGELGTSAGADSSSIAVDGLAESARPLMELVAELAREATFPVDEFERERRQRIDALRIERVTPGFLANERVRHELFGGHPYGVFSPSEEQVGAYRVDDLRAFYGRHYAASNALLIAVGDFSAGPMMEDIERVFAPWPAGDPPVMVDPPLDPWRGRRIHVVHLPDTSQARIVVANRAITRRHPDWTRLAVTNAIYGGAFHSRLVANIREQKGYTYSPGSQAHSLRRHGWFATQAAVRNEVVAATLAEMFYEMDRMRALPVETEELDEIQNYLSGVFSLGVATQAGLRGQLANVYLNELPEDYLETYRDRVRAATKEQVLESARKWIDSPNALVVVVGDREQVAPQAALFGDVKFWDAAGQAGD
ncbi:MAG TPA: pitrilysin family protein [Patescibacteria group bacterium]|nr:pitrilysin family protein [Patescibacteria group bacterium]